MANVFGTLASDVIAADGETLGFLPGVFTTKDVVGEPSDLSDNIFASEGNDVVAAGAGNDSVLGGIGDDILYGEAGNDTLRGQDGNDQIFGGDGNDLLTGAIGNDTLDGGKGNDLIFGGAGSDRLVGGEGDDTLTGARPRAGSPGRGEIDYLRGGEGIDTFVLAFRGNVFYDDLGITDYAVIEDFQSTDRIDLGGLNSTDFNISTIALGDSPLGIPSYTSITYQGDLVAVVIGDEPTNFV